MKKIIFSLCLSPLFIFHIALFAQQGTWLTEIANSGSLAARHEAGYVAVGNNFYLVGGRGIKPVNIYNPQSKNWTDGAAPPMEIHHFQPVEYNGKIYAIGAMTGAYPSETPIANVHIYDPGTNTWSTGASIPSNRLRGSAGLVVHNDKFYLVCGIQNGHQSGHVNWLDVYDPANNTWQVLADAPRARDHFHASVVNGKIYAVAGRRSIASQNVFANTIDEVDVYDIATNQWTTLTQKLPTERAGSFNAIYQQEILVFGGESAGLGQAHSEVEALNTENGNWRTLSPMPNGRHGTGAVWYLDTLYTASGSGGQGGGPELSSQDKFFFGGSSTGLFDKGEINPFRISANTGASTTLYIQYEGLLRNLEIQIFSLSGQLIAGKKGINDFPFSWNLAPFAIQEGLYLIQVSNETNIYWSKVLITN